MAIIKFITEEEMKKRIEAMTLELDFAPYVQPMKLTKLEDLPRKAAIYILRMLNIHRAKGEVDEYINEVLLLTLDRALQEYPCVLDITACYYPERKAEIDKIKEELKKALKNIPTDMGDIYTIISTFGEYLFVTFDTAHYFQDEPEYKDLVGKTVFEVYKTDIDPDKVKKLDDLTKNDAIRLVRVINSLRQEFRKDMINKFLSDIGDFESVYDLFSLYVGYIFHEYENANYFLDEPELDPKEKEFQTREFDRPVKFEGEFD